MNLAQIRKDFIEATGRVDLVVDLVSYVDKGANEFIRRGQAMLDRMPYEGKNEYAEVGAKLDPGKYRVEMAAIRSIRNVRIENTEGTYFLRKTTVQDIQYALGLNSFGQVSAERGTPFFYAAASARSVGAPTADTEGKRGILVYPPAEQGVNVIVDGLFFSAPLTVDASVSFWTLVHPETLVQAAWYMLERYYRNSEGMKDHIEAIERDLRGIDMDYVDEITSGIDEMGDSWRYIR